ISGVPVGTYNLRFSKAGYVGATVTGIVVAKGEQTAVPAQELRLQRGAIGGTVELEDRSDPSVVEVVLGGTSYRSAAATDGRFSISEVPPGIYLVEYRAASPEATGRYQPTQATVTVTAGSTTAMPGVLLRLARGEVGGLVTLEGAGAGEHDGVVVEVVGTGLFGTSLPSGVYAIAGIPVGTHSLRFSKAGYTPANEPGVGVVVAAAAAAAKLTTVPARELLISRGHLYCLGQPGHGQGVTFTSNRSSPAVGDWRSIKISSSSLPGRIDYDGLRYLSGNLLYNATVEYAGEGALLLTDTSLAVIASTVQESKNTVGIPCWTPSTTCTGGAFSAVNSNLLLVASVVENNDAADPEDGSLAGSALIWESDVDGPLGTGSTLEVRNLSLCRHRIWLAATDSAGQQGRTWVEIEVVNDAAAAR
ncbi:MAG: carboxypeptidase regulatory-like domain-containing protein, partial [Pseudomonadota bacterium]